MDIAYDQIQEEALSPKDQEEREKQQGGSSLNTEFQEAFKAVSSSPWGAKLGGFFGQVKKQSESLYSDAQKEYSAASSQASKGLTDLRSTIIDRTRDLTISQDSSDAPTSYSDPTFTLPEKDDQRPISTTATSTTSNTDSSAARSSSSSTPTVTDATTTASSTETFERPESLPADIVKEASSMVSRFRSEATRRLAEIQKAEDAADEALLKFGSNVRNFLRDAVIVTGPDDGPEGSSNNGTGSGTGSRNTAEVLFETNDAEGRRVFHSSRFDARVHVIHSREESFTRDPDSPEWAGWEKEFDVEKMTDTIAKDLDKYEELRRQMGRLVPERVEYKAFWRRYYFLRRAVEEEARRRKEVLQGASVETEEDLGWGDDDDEDEEDRSRTPNGNAANLATAATTSTTTLTEASATKDSLAVPAEPRRSEEDGKSTAGSDASYDMVSGATSRAPGSPKEEKKVETETAKKDESDDEDWE